MSQTDEPGGPNPIGEAFGEFIKSELEHYIGHELTTDLVKYLGNIASTLIFDFVGVTETSRILGISKQRVSQMYNEGKLPPAAGEIRASKFWLWAQIDEFSNSYNPKGRTT